jgi:hypothetical protein
MAGALAPTRKPNGVWRVSTTPGQEARPLTSYVDDVALYQRDQQEQTGFGFY